MTNYVNINPGPKSETDGKREFSALVRVKTSRYAERKYGPDTNLASRLAIRWTLESTRGSVFEKDWSTGLEWESNKDKISPDGRRIAVEIKKSSDAFYMLQKAVNEAGFPSERLTSDIGVFDGETFFIATDQNPRAQGSARKPYPKTYYPQGWEAAKAEQAARRAEYEARQAGATAPSTPVSSYTPPVIIKPDIKQVAGETLVAIVAGKGRVKQTDLLAELNKYIDVNKPQWAATPSVRENVTIAFWTYNQIADIAKAFNLHVEGDASGFAISK